MEDLNKIKKSKKKRKKKKISAGIASRMAMYESKPKKESGKTKTKGKSGNIDICWQFLNRGLKLIKN